MSVIGRSNVGRSVPIDGAFAQFVKALSQETYAVVSDLSDIELAAIPCAFSTAEGMLHRASVRKGERVLVTGA
jgi:NADPH:quinone reductase-like Zn-dependent oxidoreductase